MLFGIGYKSKVFLFLNERIYKVFSVYFIIFAKV